MKFETKLAQAALNLVDNNIDHPALSLRVAELIIGTLAKHPDTPLRIEELFFCLFRAAIRESPETLDSFVEEVLEVLKEKGVSDEDGRLSESLFRAVVEIELEEATGPLEP